MVAKAVQQSCALVSMGLTTTTTTARGKDNEAKDCRAEVNKRIWTMQMLV